MTTHSAIASACGPHRLMTAALILACQVSAEAIDSTTVFNEVMYNPAAAGGAEWIELHNQMAINMDLSGWQITGGVNFTFPAGTTIAAGGYLVVAGDAAAVAGSIGPWIGSLDNDGESLRLKNVSGRTMDELSYQDSGRWPVGADGSGATLAKRDAGGSGAEPEAWAASRAMGGTPGAANAPDFASPDSGVRLSELAGTTESVFRIELKNEGNAPALLEGMKLGAFTLPGATLAPGGFMVFDEAQLGFRPADGERVFLHAPGGGLLDAAIARATGRARLGGRMLVPAAATFGAENVVSLTEDIVINEIMYHFPPNPGSPGSSAVVSSTVLVPLDATWRYNRSNADLGTTWAEALHPVSGEWPSGQGLLGFETTPASLPETLRTPIATSNAPTYYFETDFTLTAEQIAATDELRLESVIDDGAAFYINGVEVKAARVNLPAGFSFATLASAGVPTAVLSQPVSIPIAGLTLQPGPNRLSIEVHQQVATGDDMICGARLSAVTILTPAVAAQPVTENPEEWIELHNPGAAQVSLAGWRLDGAVDFTFPPGTTIPGGDFLVVANDAAALQAKWPEVASKIVGNFSGGLSNAGERLRLEDAVGNPADDVRYVSRGWADGGGSSLELRDPRSDNANPSAWAVSDESGKSAWQSITYRLKADQKFGPTTWNEFRLGLLDAGECLIDDLSVKEDPDGAASERMRDVDFETLPAGAKWRFLGNHRTSAIVGEDGNPANHLLRLSSSGPMETNHNHAESTFLPISGKPALIATTLYEVSFRARWLAGTNQLNTRAYYQRLARTHELPIPSRLGTPGAANSRRVANAGPTVSALTHAPAIPPANAPVTVSFSAHDPDGVASAMLWFRANGVVSFSSLPMTQAAGAWSASLPGQPPGAIVQFYVEVTDVLGATTLGPAAGSESRALVQWADNQTSALPVQQLRLIMLTADRTFLLASLNRLSNERIPGSLVYRGAEIFYDVGVRLQGTAAGRVRDGEDYVGYDIGLPADHLFRGVHESIGVDRSGRSPVVRQQHEIFVRHTFNRAGIPCPVDDLCYFIAPQTIHTGPAILQLASYSGLWANSQFDEDGTVFNYDITYDPTSTSVAGNVESVKPPVPFIHVSTDLANLGDDKEQYRGPFDIRAGKRRDDYRALITLCKTMALPTPQLAVQAPQVLDLDEVLRCTALVNLWGIADTYYVGGLPHNIRIFTPDDATGVNFLPWDMDFVMNGATTSALIPSGNNLGRLISSIPANKRLYLGHIRHLCATVFKSSYLTPWLTHYGAVVGQNFSSAISYINGRSTYAATQYGTPVAYAITTNGGADFSVAAREAVVEGTGWIDIHEIRRAGSLDPIAITWPTVNTWRAVLPLAPGANPIALEAYDFDGALIAARSITVTNSIVEPSPRDVLRLTELHYHPADPATAAEQAAGTTDSEFEFIELKNTGPQPLRLDGVHFGAGVDFAFPSGVTLGGGQFAVVVRNRAAFEARYGAGITILGEYLTDALSNSGEPVTLLDGTGAIIQSFIFSDDWFPSTDGPGWSMVARNEDAPAPDLNAPGAWAISFQRHGNPGAPNGSVASTEFEGWRHQSFAPDELADPLLSGPDAERGGLSNLLRYALGLTPSQPASAGLNVTARGVGPLDLAYRRLIHPLDLEYTPESSTDLITWIADAAPVSVTHNGDGTDSVVVRFYGTARKFVRLKVTGSP